MRQHHYLLRLIEAVRHSLHEWDDESLRKLDKALWALGEVVFQERRRREGVRDGL